MGPAFPYACKFDDKNKRLTAQDLVSSLVDSGVEAVAVTDHHTMDPDLILEMQRFSAGTLTVFPGIELRSRLVEAATYTT